MQRHSPSVWIRKAKSGAFIAADRIGRLAAISGVPFRVKGRGSEVVRSESVDALVENHFQSISEVNHLCRVTLTRAIVGLREQPAKIIETGSSAYGTDSSTLFDAYVCSFGGSFETVDIRARPMLKLRTKLSSRSHAHCNDSIVFLNKWALENKGETVNLAYLDSWDLSAQDPWPSANHGLKEFIALESNLKSGSLLLIDDTPVDLSYFVGQGRAQATAFFNRNGLIPGKGMLVIELLKARKDVKMVCHEYQVLFQFL